MPKHQKPSYFKAINLKNSQSKTGFSLIELSVAILIISIITVGMLPLIKTSKMTDKVKITNDRINTIYRSLANFTAINTRLPCPARLDIVKATSAYGNETPTPGTCTGSFTSTNATNLVYGMVPITALNLPIEMAEDGWGNKFEYIVDKRFTIKTKDDNDTQGFEYQQTIDYPGGTAPTIINIYDGAIVSASNALFVILSHGTNGYKAWPVDAATQRTTSGSNPDELKNSRDENTNNFDNSFYASSATYNTNFDDILFYKNKQQLVQDAGMEFIRCSALDGRLQYPFTQTADQTKWGDCNVTATANFKTMIQGATGSYSCPTGCTANGATMDRACDKYGVWANSVVSGCKKSVHKRRIFVSSIDYDGNLKGSAADGISGADQKCTDLANTASLGGGPWKAWISTPTVSAVSRITNNTIPFYLVDETTIVSYSLPPSPKTYVLENPISKNEFGIVVSKFVFTGTDPTGVFGGPSSCSNWSSNTGNFAYVGNPSATGNEWTRNAFSQSCIALKGIYCYEDLP